MFTTLFILQFDPETTPATVRYHGPPQVMLAYLKYQWSLGEDHKRKEAFARLQVLHFGHKIRITFPITRSNIMFMLHALSHVFNFVIEGPCDGPLQNSYSSASNAECISGFFWCATCCSYIP